MLCARVVRGAASSAKAVSPALARRCRPAPSNGLSMPTTTVPGFISALSRSSGVRTLSTISAPNAPAASVISAPAAWYAASVTLAATPAPACTRTTWPCATSFFAVSGVTATRVSPGTVSAGTPIFIQSASQDSFEFDDHRVERERITAAHVNLRHHTGALGAERDFHLHGLDDAQGIAGRHGLAHFRGDRDDHRRHRAAQLGTGGRLLPLRHPRQQFGLACRQHADLGLRAGMGQRGAIAGAAKLHRHRLAVDRAPPDRLPRNPIGYHLVHDPRQIVEAHAPVAALTLDRDPVRSRP